MLQAYATSIISPYEFSAKDILPPEMAVHEAATRAQKSKPLTALLQSFPSLARVTQRLAEQITHIFPAANAEHSLLTLALVDALNAYREAATNSVEGFDQRDIPGYYIKALLDRAANVTEFEVRAVDGMGEGERWEVANIPLSAWIAARPEKRIIFTERACDPAEKEVARLMLAAQTLSMNDARLFYRVKAK